MGNFKVGDKVRIRKMPTEYVGPFNHQDVYTVYSYFGSLVLLENDTWGVAARLMDFVGYPNIILERVDISQPQQITLPTLEEKPKPEPTESDRMLAFFKASAHDPNARW